MNRNCLVRLVATASVAGAIAQSVAAAPPETVLAPSSPWQVDFGEERCAAIRLFGTDKEKIAFRLIGTGYSRQMALIGESIPLGQTAAIIRLQTDKQAAPISANGYAFRTKDGRELVQWEDDSKAVVLAWRTASTLTVRIGSWNRTFPMHQFDGVMAKVEECEKQVMLDWGVSPEQIANYTGGPSPKNNPGTWLTPADYPPNALSSGFEGITVFALDVEADGSVSKCSILRSSSVQALDAAACKAVTRRARFQPALDGRGQPIKSRYINRASFSIP